MNCSRYDWSTGCLHIGHTAGRGFASKFGRSSDVIRGTSWLEPGVESSSEDSGEETVVAASKDVGGADETRGPDGRRSNCLSEMPSLFVTVLRASFNSSDFNASASASIEGFIVGADHVVARGGFISWCTMGIALNFGTFLGDGRGGNFLGDG